MSNPSDGRITSLDRFTGSLATSDLLMVVSPGTAATGINYALPFGNLASSLASSILPNGSTGTILFGQGVSSSPKFLPVSGDLTVTNNSAVGTATIATHAVTFAKFQQVPALSVVGVVGTATATADVGAITGAAGQVLRVNDVGTGLGFGAVNLASAAAVTGVLPLAMGGWSTTLLTAFGVVYGNGSSTPGITAAGTAAWALMGNGTLAAPTFQQINLTASVTGVLPLSLGGWSTTTLTAFGVVFGTGTSKPGITAAGTTGWPLVGNGTSLAPGFAVLSVPGGGTNTTILTAHGVLIGAGTSTVAISATQNSGDIFVGQNTTIDPAWKPVALDLTMSSAGTATVVGLYGRPLLSTAPTTSQVVTWNGTSWAPATAAAAAAATTKFFGGRVTLVSNTPVLLSDQTAKSNIFYTPYIHDLISIASNATGSFQTYQFTERTLNLDTTNATAGFLYDLCVATSTGAIYFGYASGWTNNTTRQIAFTTVEGVWVNSVSVLLRSNATTTASIGTGLATLVGTFYSTANGQTGMNFKPTAATGGTNNILGLANVFNTVPLTALCTDTTSVWSTTKTTAFEAMNASLSWRVTWVDPLQHNPVVASMYIVGSNSVAGANVQAGAALNSTTATPSQVAAGVSATASGNVAATVIENFFPQLGANFIQAVQRVSNNTGTYNGGGFCGMTVTVPM